MKKFMIVFAFASLGLTINNIFAEDVQLIENPQRDINIAPPRRFEATEVMPYTHGPVAQPIYPFGLQNPAMGMQKTMFETQLIMKRAELKTWNDQLADLHRQINQLEQRAPMTPQENDLYTNLIARKAMIGEQLRRIENDINQICTDNSAILQNSEQCNK